MKPKSQRNVALQIGWITVLLIVMVVAGCSSNNNDPENEPTEISDAKNDSNNAPAQDNSNQETTEPDVNSATGELKLPLTDEKVTVKWMLSERPDAPIKKDWLVTTTLFERTNVQVEFDAVPGSGYPEKKKILMATNSVPDVMVVDANEATQFGPDGIFLAVDELIEKHAPNIRRALEQYPDARAVSTAVDGKMYYFPTLSKENYFSFAWMGRGDLMEKYGIEQPKTPDDFYQMLKTLKEHHPDSYPFTMRANGDGSLGGNGKDIGIYKEFMRAFTELDNTALPAFIGFNPYTVEFKFAGHHENFRDMLEFMKKLYVEKLIDPEFAFLKKPQWEQRLLAGDSLVTYDYKSRVDQFTNDSKKADAATEYKMVPLTAWAAEGIRPMMMAKSVVQGNNGLAIGPNVKNPEVVVKLIDYLYSEEGQILTNIGVEGISYEKKDGKLRFTLDTPNVDTDIRGMYGLNYDGIRQTGTIPDEMIYTPTDTLLDETYEGTIKYSAKAFNKTEELVEMEKDNGTTLDKYLQATVTEFIVGRKELNDQTYQEFIKQCEDMGIQKFVDEYNRLYKEAYGN